MDDNQTIKDGIEEINSYLLKISVFIIVGKDSLKKKLHRMIDEIVDESFSYIEKDLKSANDNVNKIKKAIGLLALLPEPHTKEAEELIIKHYEPLVKQAWTNLDTYKRAWYDALKYFRNIIEQSTINQED